MNNHVGYVGFGPQAQSTLPPIKKLSKRRQRKLQELIKTTAAQISPDMALEDDLTAYRMGECLIFVGTVPYWHLSISHPARYPTWDEIAHARYSLMPDEKVILMSLPPRVDYVAVHPFCMQLFEWDHFANEYSPSS